MRTYKRADRVAELIQADTVKILRDIKELDKGLLTITKVKLTDDLQTCRIFYSVIGTEADKKNADTVLTEKLKQKLLERRLENNGKKLRRMHAGTSRYCCKT